MNELRIRVSIVSTNVLRIDSQLDEFDDPRVVYLSREDHQGRSWDLDGVLVQLSVHGPLIECKVSKTTSVSLQTDRVAA